MEVIKEIDNGILNRKEVFVVERYNSNPGYEQALKLVSENFKVGEDVVVVKRVGSHFGDNNFLIEAFVYDSVENKEKIEPKKKEKEKK
jgi:ribosomal protein S24E